MYFQLNLTFWALITFFFSNLNPIYHNGRATVVSFANLSRAVSLPALSRFIARRGEIYAPAALFGLDFSVGNESPLTDSARP